MLTDAGRAASAVSEHRALTEALRACDESKAEWIMSNLFRSLRGCVFGLCRAETAM